jgi:RNA polymerase sigma factor (TIGR02999 family)
MTDLTLLLSQIESGDSVAAEQLLPLVYGELRKLASIRLAQERPGQTLQATALVHEAYLRLIGPSQKGFDGRGHFFASAAEAMRRILVEKSRQRGRIKRGGDWKRIELDQVDMAVEVSGDEILAVDEALTRLEAEDPLAAQLVKLRFFAGFSLTEAAAVLGISRTSAYEQWAYARAWLRCSIEGGTSAPPE